ncbi:MgtC/SapB family protein [Starkeya sp. ORNL1]|uniref:MgtC/SapB family protein n=1 Tax=Starkeya sp. ORNL1 TaxID=2709380 RepID=UPI001463BC1D|nr:MgtC/SapB family protein [Starkeya sp. ORNL1]QJP13858.1 MgtC/SapB family protein [Starkeya sp. ORNL1]
MFLSDADIEAVLRLLAAAVIGMGIGINRDLHGKPTGMRTLGLVCMGATLVSLTALRVDGIAQHPDATSRVVQGILQGVLTGIGFVGAGVVLRDPAGRKVHGLTTAATVWVTAALGIACALADWHLIFLGAFMTVLLLSLVKPLERLVESIAGERREEGNTRAGETLRKRESAREPAPGGEDNAER